MNALNKIENQNLVSRILGGILKTGRIANAYLFIGPSGTGKKFAALQFAKALNCEKGGCEECLSCIKIGEFSHPDVQLIEPEIKKDSQDEKKDTISIEQMRNMQRDAYLKPFIAKYKIYIIVEAGRMLESASNSMLKIIEEPPQSAIFILTTSSPQDILPTIISRCQIVRFRQGFKTREDNPEMEEKVFSLLGGKEIPHLLREVKGITSNKIEATEVVDLLALWYRDILLVKEKNNEFIIFRDKMLSEQLRNMEKLLPEDFLVEAISEIIRARHLLARNVSPRLTLETLFLKLIGDTPSFSRHRATYGETNRGTRSKDG